MKKNNKRNRKLLNILFFVILFVMLCESFYIYLDKKNHHFIQTPSYSFTDTSNLVVAKGSWNSSTDLAYPVQAIHIECWKGFGYCWIIDATLKFDDTYLSLWRELAKIARWDDQAIETVPEKTTGGCVEYSYRLDRHNKTVTSVRKTVDNTSAICKGIQSEPIIMHLGD